MRNSKSMEFRRQAEYGGMGEEADNPLLFAFWTCFQLERYGRKISTGTGI